MRHTIVHVPNAQQLLYTCNSLPVICVVFCQLIMQQFAFYTFRYLSPLPRLYFYNTQKPQRNVRIIQQMEGALINKIQILRYTILRNVMCILKCIGFKGTMLIRIWTCKENNQQWVIWRRESDLFIKVAPGIQIWCSHYIFP